MTQKYFKTIFALMGVLALVLLACSGASASGKKVTVIGTVFTYLDDNKEPYVIEIVSDDGENYYDVNLDKKGRELGRKMNEKRVKVTGYLTENTKEGKVWLQVISYEELPKAEEESFVEEEQVPDDGTR
ncbi:hypothetical protein ACFLU6_05045 [Acidobacteriota bacterium]